MQAAIALILMMLGEQVEFPRTGPGVRASAYFDAFNAGEEKMREFENAHRSASAITDRSVDDRIALYRTNKSRWGELEAQKLVAASAQEIVVQVLTRLDGEKEFRFQFENDPPHKLNMIHVLSHEALENVAKPGLRQELLARAQEDQQVRKKPGWVALEMAKVDAANTRFLRKIVDEHGWPGKSMVGADGAQAAWLLVQHANADLAFQKKCLALLKEALAAKEVEANHVAYLTDRVLILENKPQIYGTQFHEVNEQLMPFPIEDEGNVDKRRGEVGLQPLAEYAAQLRAMEK